MHEMRRCAEALEVEALGSEVGSTMPKHKYGTKTKYKYDVYVAGGSSERLSRIRPLIERLIAAYGWRIYDWTRDPGWDSENPDYEECARACLEAVADSAVFWLVVPDRKSEGASTELGYALALKKPVIVLTHRNAREENAFVFMAYHIHYSEKSCECIIKGWLAGQNKLDLPKL
jgi:hypothetical protein